MHYALSIPPNDQTSHLKKKGTYMKENCSWGSIHTLQSTRRVILELNIWMNVWVLNFSQRHYFPKFFVKITSLVLFCQCLARRYVWGIIFGLSSFVKACRRKVIKIKIILKCTHSWKWKGNKFSILIQNQKWNYEFFLDWESACKSKWKGVVK